MRGNQEFTPLPRASCARLLIRHANLYPRKRPTVSESQLKPVATPFVDESQYYNQGEDALSSITKLMKKRKLVKRAVQEHKRVMREAKELDKKSGDDAAQRGSTEVSQLNVTAASIVMTAM